MRGWPLAALIAVTIIALTACGGGSSGRAASPAPSSPDAAAATATAARSDQEARIGFLETRAAGDPLDTLSLNLLAAEHMQRARETGDVAELSIARTALDRSLAIRRADNYDGLALAGALASTQHDFARGLALAQEAIAQKPSEAYAYGILGDAMMGLGRYDAAADAYARAAAGAPDDITTLGRLALLATVRGRTDDADGLWRRAVDAAQHDTVPEHLAWAHAQRAGLLFTLGRLDDAAAEYRASLDAFPGYVHALAGLGRVAAAHEDWDAAVASYSQAIERVPLPEYVIALGDVYEAAGDEGRAQQQYDLVAAIQQLYAANGVNLDLQIAQFNADHNRDLAATVQRARQTYAEQPSLQAADVLAWCELKAGNVDAARAAIERALATGTRDPLVLFHAGMIYRAAGDVVRARVLLTQVHDQAPRFSVRYALALEEALAGL